MNREITRILSAVSLKALPGVLAGTVIEWLRPLFLLPFLAKTASPRRRCRSQRFTREYKIVTVDNRAASGLRALCKAASCTVNDCLVAACAIAVKRFSKRGRIGSFYTADVRRHLDSKEPLLSNLSAITLITMPRRAVSDMASTAAHIAGKKQNQPIGLTHLFGVLPNTWLPHCLVRLTARLLVRYAALSVTRGLIVTNIGRIDPYLEPLGQSVVAASVVGPFLRGVRIPLITATGFKDTVTLHIAGFEEISHKRLEQVKDALLDSLPGAKEVGSSA